VAIDFALELVRRLSQQQQRLVLAESCTGGMICAELARIPGVSDWLCGSAVTYRSDTKIRWLGVRAEDIERYTAVSQQVASQMALGVLERTTEAALAASVTGHLGPRAPSGLDGVVWIGIARRSGDTVCIRSVSRHQLLAVPRQPRQAEAAALVLSQLLSELA
jgi:PncC family amidohydrolase